MARWRRVLKWVCFALLMAAIAATIAVLVLGMLEMQEIDRQAQSGAELLAGAVLAGALVTGIPMALFTEISVYRNCRYFLVGKKKTALTVLNAVMLVVSAAWVVGLRLSFDTFYQIGEYIWFGSFGVLLLLRFAYAWILSCTSPEPDSTPSESTPTPPES